MTEAPKADIGADYAHAGFGGRLPFGQKPAVLIIDVVDAYLTPGCGLYDAAFEPARDSCIRLAAAGRAAGVPVILTNVVFTSNGADGGWFYKKVAALKAFDQGSPLGAFPAGLHEPTDIVVSKQYASAFFGTTLASTLRALGVDTVVMGGFSTSGCVRASGLDTLQHGFIPYVVSDACADRDPRPHEANLFDLQAKYAEVVPEAEAIRLIAGVNARAA